MLATERQIAANRANRRRWKGHTEDGLRRLRDAALRNKPWLRSTGPKTETGKQRSKLNALKHGGRSGEVVTARKQMAEIMRAVRGLRHKQVYSPSRERRRSQHSYRKLRPLGHRDFKLGIPLTLPKGLLPPTPLNRAIRRIARLRKS